MHFRSVLSTLSKDGRMEHHYSAHAIFDSHASNVIEAVASIQEREYGARDMDFPSSLSDLSHQANLNDDLLSLSSHLDESISVAETRWSMVSCIANPYAEQN
jgi:hypothetical protein